MLAWLSVWSEMQNCIWPSGCYCHSLSLASVKSRLRLVLPFWYRLTRVVPDKGPLNVCVLASCLCTLEYCGCVMVCKAELFAVFVVRSGEDKVLHRLVPLRRSAARRRWHRHGAGDDALPRPRQCTQDFHVPARPKTPNAVTRPAFGFRSHAELASKSSYAVYVAT